MKHNIAILTCTALLAVGMNVSSAQPKKAEAKTPTALALAPEPPEPPQPPAVAVANFDDAVDAYQLATGWGGQGGGASGGRAMVIPREPGDVKEFADMEEDLNVMARILEKAASGRDGRHPHAMGIAIQTGVFGSSAVPKNLYIEGHGALFFLNVNFPLLPPAAKSSDTDDKEKTSTEWEEARRELYQRPGSGFEFKWKPAVPGGPAEEYDADKVEELKRDVTAALKNASHIRKLKSDETVTVVISGRSAGGETRIVKRSSSGSGAATGGESRTGKRSTGGGTSAAAPRLAAVISRSGGGESQGTRLILRARKADLDAFQRDKLSVEDFQKKVTTIVY
jgi:hypothetical protein